jgi:hypothetical protein
MPKGSRDGLWDVDLGEGKLLLLLLGRFTTVARGRGVVEDAWVVAM